MDATVKILLYTDDEIQATVTNNKTKKEYLVSCIVGYWRCDCTDWYNRWKLIEGAYLCKHIEKVHEKIIRMKIRY